VAPLPDRAAVVSQRLAISVTQATQRVRDLDQQHAKFIQDHFLKDPRDPHHYDQLLNSARLGVDGCAEAIVSALRVMQARQAKTVGRTAQVAHA